MTDLDRLLAAILANPADDAARLVYADKIQERDGPGDAERAEFIRVQVAIARHNPKDCNQGLCRTAGYGPCSACRDLDALRERERELFAPFAADWFPECNRTTPVTLLVLPCEPDFDAPTAIVSRGFIQEVRAPLATLVGGETTRSVYERGEYGPNRYQETIRTPAVLPAIAQANPLERVRATDKRPLDFDGRWLWHNAEHRLTTSDYDGDTRPADHLPAEVFNRLSGFIPQSNRTAEMVRSWKTQHDARAALSRALIAWARKEQPCTT